MVGNFLHPRFGGDHQIRDKIERRRHRPFSPSAAAAALACLAPPAFLSLPRSWPPLAIGPCGDTSPEKPRRSQPSRLSEFSPFPSENRGSPPAAKFESARGTRSSELAAREVTKRKMKRMTPAQFEAEAMRVHKGKYKYSGLKFVHSKKKIDIECPEHQIIFQQKAPETSFGATVPKVQVRADASNAGPVTRELHSESAGGTW